MPTHLIGILVDPYIFEQIFQQTSSRENASFYEEGAKAYNRIPIFFRLRDINLREKTVKALIKRGERYAIETFPIPDVIHHRIIPKNRRENKKIANLFRLGKRLFNPVTRLRKWTVYRILHEEKEGLIHLPHTVRANHKNLRFMMKQHDRLLLKPDNGSIGEGIMRLEKEGSGWRLDYPIREEGRIRWEKVYFSNEIPPILHHRFQQRKYLIQERILFLQMEGSPFDLRVAVQKTYGGTWDVTGIVAKVARKGHFLTNVARGGRCIPADEEMQKLIHPLALIVAKQIEKKIPSVADLGLDIGIREDGVPFLIEANLRDLRITFRNAGLYETWKQVHTTPMAYAAYLLDKT